MNDKMKHFNNLSFYEFYESLKTEDKKHLRLKISRYCRKGEQQVKNWMSQKSIPFSEADRVTKAVIQFAPVVDLIPESITEKKLFPNYAHLVDSYA